MKKQVYEKSQHQKNSKLTKEQVDETVSWQDDMALKNSSDKNNFKLRIFLTKCGQNGKLKQLKKKTSSNV